MRLFTIPQWVKKHTNLIEQDTVFTTNTIQSLRDNLQRFNILNPEVSIVIPAYNEEENILQTLSSLAALKTSYRTELIVANNNSTDRTQELLDLCGVRSVFIAEQGISYARQGGLEKAKGHYIVNADADSIYPSTWLDALVEPLQRSEISCSYGLYSFIPGGKTARFTLGLYEIVAQSFKQIKRRNREFVDVMGFNFAFRKEDAIAVGGYRHDLNRRATGRSEDGWMAFCLLKQGKIQRVGSVSARAWTSDRRLMAYGSLGKAYLFRAKKELRRLDLYFTSRGIVKHTEQ